MNYQSNEVAKITADFVNTTNQNVFLTGKAGTGKTTFLKYIIAHTHKKTVVAAPTGIAAINANGVTLHSLLQLPFGAFIPERITPPSTNAQFTTLYNLFSNLRFNATKRSLIQQMELLIIDEVSMLRADMLDCIDHMLRHLRKRKNEAFGGAQILFIGDLLQLPPVVKDDEWNILKSYYPSSYFFEAKALAHEPLVHLELEKVYRQSDEKFINILNRLRENKQTKEDLEFLNQHFRDDLNSDEVKGYIHLTTHNRKADQINSDRLKDLAGKTFTYTATIEGDFPDNAQPVTEKLTLKEGAQVMFIKNDPTGEGQFFNGKIGSISALSESQIKVKFEDDSEVRVSQYTWENKRFTLNKNTKEIDEKILGSYTHFPIKLAWAVTIHKSQGLTFEKAILDLTAAFTQGQVYVALSRLTSLDGLVLSSKIPLESFDISSSMKAFIAEKPEMASLEKKLESDRLNYFYGLICEHFDFNLVANTLNAHIASFNKGENRSVKQQYLDWTKEASQPLIALQTIARSFQAQVHKILFQEEDIQLLAERVEKAKDYFNPILKEGLEKFSFQEKKLKRQATLKTYRTELKEIHELIFDKQLAINRASLFISFIAKGQVPAKKDMQSALQEMIIPKTKTEKTPTHEISLQLYKEGKSVQEIASERGFVDSTIESHLSKYLMSGEVSATDLIDKDKLKNILSLITSETSTLTEVKSQLGDEYTYGEVRIALTEWERLNTQH